jgi:hypothetical protein
MGKVSFNSCGEIGVIKDLPADELEPRAWSDVRNIRFVDKKAKRMPSPVQVFGTPSGVPYWLMPVQSGATALWVYADGTKLYATDGASHADVSRAVGGAYSTSLFDLWSGGILSGIPVITNGVDIPQFYASPALANKFANLTNWPVSNPLCDIIKPFKSFLVAMSVTKAGTKYPHLVKWSHVASPGAIPSSWDETDPTKLAGEAEIVDEFPGGIQEGAGLGDTFIIYKDNTVWGMQYAGGNNVFRFFQIFQSVGAMGRHCVSEINKGRQHFVFTGDDIIVHDGADIQSVMDRKLRSWMFNQIPEAKQNVCFTVAFPEANEAWACFPTGNDTYCSLALVYNWKFGTATIKNFATNVSHMTGGPIAQSSDPWDLDSNTWASDATSWDLSLFSPHSKKILAARPSSNGIFLAEDAGITYSDVSYIERTGLAVSGQDRVTGELIADNDTMKIVDRIWIRATGVPFSVQIGGAEFKEATVNYQTAQTFTPGSSKYLDFAPVHAKFIAVKFSSNASFNGEFIIEGFDLNINVAGEQ